MTDWKTYKGQYPWPLVPVVDKTSYNEGNKISTSTDPTWKVNDNLGHTPITTIHEPCSYWPKMSVPILNPRAYTYITALFNDPPYPVARVNYYTSVLDPTFASVPDEATTSGAFPQVYNGKLYVWNKSITRSTFTVWEVDLELKVVTRYIDLTPPDGLNSPGPGCLVGNMLYVTCSCDSVAGPNFRMRIYEIDLSTFTATGRNVGIAFSYGSLLGIRVTGNFIFLVTWTYVVVFSLASFTYLSSYMFTGASDGYCAAFNNEKTECVIARNNYTPCLMKVSLTNPPVLLGTQNTSWLPNSNVMSMATDINNNVYVSDKFNLKLYKFNLTAFDTAVLYDYLSTGTAFTGLVCAGEDLWCINNYAWINVYRKIVRIKLATMAVDHIINIPSSPYSNSIHSVVIY
jgi:hypothetical protein